MSYAYKTVPTSKLLYINKVLLSCKTLSQVKWTYSWGVKLLSKMSDSYNVINPLFELLDTKNQIVKRIEEASRETK